MNYAEDERVRFERPDWEDLRDRGFAAVDMHYHTNHSDSYTDIRRAVKLAESRNVGFAVTDHNVVGGAVEASGIRTDVLIVPGIEISAWDGPHILAYFYSVGDLVDYWTRNIRDLVPRSPSLAVRMDTEDILDSLEGENCVISAAHPMGYAGFNKGVQKCIDRSYLDGSITERMDAYEVICSGMSRSSNVQALEWADRHGLGYTGGTDGHMMREVGRVVTCSDRTDIDGFLNSIKKGTNFIIGTEKDARGKMEMGMAAFAQYMRYIPSSLAIHCRQNMVRVRGCGKRKRSGQ